MHTFNFSSCWRWSRSYLCPIATFALVFCGYLSGLPAAEPSREGGLNLDFERPVQEMLGNEAQLTAGAKIEPVGPNSEQFVGLPTSNSALVLNGKGARIQIPDTQDAGPLDFNTGDEITLEAWVRPDRLGNEVNVYIIGKGRTFEVKRVENQNYALRLRGVAGEAHASFLFATSKDDGAKEDGAKEYHRWTSDRGFIADGSWHHVAVSYQFGKPTSIVCVIDGETSKGKWDMGGATDKAPVVDNDSLWIGSSRGGEASSSFAGALDDVRLHRSIVPVNVLKARRQPITKAPTYPAALPKDLVTVTIHGKVGSHSTWPMPEPAVVEGFTASHLAFHRLPMRYIAGGNRQPWQGPLLLKAYCRTQLPAGELTFMLRSPGLARLWMDGEIILSTPAHQMFGDAHQPFEVYQADHPWLHVPRAGDFEKRCTLPVIEGEHEFILEQIVGAKGIRCETGDTTVALKRGDELFTLLGPTPFDLPLSDDGWKTYHATLEAQLTKLDRTHLHEMSAKEDAFWKKRHDQARKTIASKESVKIPASTPGVAENNAIDRFINANLKPEQDRLASDAAFLRRIYLDTVGVVPNAEATRKFLKDNDPAKREKVIDQLLNDDRWADHWTSYWQDVLAENPSILKPTLNNSGPFRWWIHDALLENKPMDRFVTELIRMEGDVRGGGAAGFSMASENDVPLAAKAHILTAAFLGVEMKCARCHDAPFHPWTQKELFGIAAMLDNKSIKVPSSSSVPKEFFDRKKGDSPITLSIFPGDEIQPRWPFEDLNGSEPAGDMLDRDNATREKLAAYFTSAENERFAQVLANRMWQRVMGWGVMGLLGDWHDQTARQPELLVYLGRELVNKDYNYKELARAIFQSRAYQRQAIDGEGKDRQIAYTAPWLRRLTAEQVVDSLHELANVEMGTEEITFDPSSQQAEGAFLNLGVAKRAWQLTSLSNERDRPSLSLPKAAAVIECLEAFGWRGARQEPVSHRETDANMVQPGVIANSAMSVRLSRLSEESGFTRLAIDAKTPEQFVDDLFEQILTRMPTDAERAVFVEQLSPGFAERIVTLAMPETKPNVHRGFVTWSNHFDIRANQLMRDIEKEVAAGPTPSSRLKADWRERAEDAIWSLFNSPEFQFIP